MDAHEAAVAAALRAGDELGRLTDRLGTAEHPRGQVLTAYRNANRGMRDVLGRESQQGEAAEVVSELRRSVRATAQETLLAASAAGVRLAQAQLAVNGIPVQDLPPAVLQMQAPSVQPALDAWMGTVDLQAQTMQALLLAGADAAEIVGDEERQGVLRPAPVIAEGSRWLAMVLAGTAVAVVDWLLQRRAGQPRERWYHQAVAAIDERTTDCCLRVNGQVQPLDQPFRLTGTPRYANELEHPPFHRYCRTAEALVREESTNDELTRGMVAAGRTELAARGPEGRNRVEIHPAHARSKRPGR